VAQHRFTAATLPWEKVNCIVLTLATKVHIAVAQNLKKYPVFTHRRGALEPKYHSKCSTGFLVYSPVAPSTVLYNGQSTVK